ncbi:MAG: DUF1761 domain-containing protein [Cyclobacteriaceae bacterium]|nr:DUF1761 domain-containing protein [Cyclobacteriaceae bacterium]
MQMNYWAVLVSALSAFLLGGLWFGPLFGKAWMKANGFTEESLKGKPMGMIFGLSFVLMLVAAVNLTMFIGPESRIEMGALWGFLAGFGWVATFLGVIYLFERRPLGHFLINALYCILALTIMGAILAVWK